MANHHEMLPPTPSPEPRRTSYLASGVSVAAAGLVGLGCELAGDVAASFLDGFGASVSGGKQSHSISDGSQRFACTSWAQRRA